MSKATWLQRFFFVTYAAFLLPSIPHIAAYFLAFEGNEQGASLWFWIGVSYLIAVAIDGTLLWLTHTVARDTRSAGYRAIIWLFIVFLVLLSGFLNWHVAQHNAVIASQKLSGAFLPNIDPVIASLFPVLAIMYAVMSQHIFAEVKAETLEEKAARLESEKSARERIQAARKGRITSRVKDAISGAGDIVSHAGATFARHSPDTELDTEPDTGATLNGYSDTVQTRATGRVYLSLNVASERYGYSVSYLTKLIQTGKVKTHRSDKTRVLESSLIAYAATNGRKTLKLPVVQIG